MRMKESFELSRFARLNLREEQRYVRNSCGFRFTLTPLPVSTPKLAVGSLSTLIEPSAIPTSTRTRLTSFFPNLSTSLSYIKQFNHAFLGSRSIWYAHRAQIHGLVGRGKYNTLFSYWTRQREATHIKPNSDQLDSR